MVVLALLLVLPMACGGPDGPVASAPPTGSVTTMADTDHGPPYTLMRSDGWRLHEAIDLHGDEPTATITRPFMDWYAEYTREEPTGDGMTISSSVVLTGHRESLDDVLSDMAAQGVTFTTADTGARPIFVGRTDRSVVAVIDGDPVLMLVGNDSVSEADLLAVANTVERVDGDAWTAAGGRQL